MGGRIPMINAINWDRGIDQIEKGGQGQIQGAQLVGGALSQAASQNFQSSQNGQRMFMDGLKFYAEYDQREDQARRDQSRLSMQQAESQQTMKFQAELQPLQKERESLAIGKMNDDNAWEQQKRFDESVKLTREEEMRQSAQGAEITDWEKKNRKPVNEARSRKEAVAPDSGMPANWDQMTPDAKQATIRRMKELGSEEMDARAGKAKVETLESQATTAGVTAENAPAAAKLDIAAKKAGIDQTRASTGLTKAQTAKTEVDTTKSVIEMAQAQAAKGSQFAADSRTGGMDQYIPKNKVDEERKKDQGEVFKKSEEKSFAFSQNQRSERRINEIMFGQADMPEGGWTSAQKDEAHSKVSSFGFSKSGEAKELAGHMTMRASAQRMMFGGGPTTAQEQETLKNVHGNPGAVLDLVEWASVEKQFNSRAYFNAFTTRSTNDAEAARKSIGAEQGKDLSFVDPEKQTRMRWRMSGEQKPYNDFAQMPVNEQSILAFGVDRKSTGPGQTADVPRWTQTQESLDKYNRYQDFQSGDAQNTEKYRPATQTTSENPFKAGSNEARVYSSASKANFLANAPPKIDQPIMNANGTQFAPGNRGNGFFTADDNGKYSSDFSRATGQPTLSTPRPKQSEERITNMGYANPQAKQKQIHGIFKSQ